MLILFGIKGVCTCLEVCEVKLNISILATLLSFLSSPPPGPICLCVKLLELRKQCCKGQQLTDV